MLLLVVITAVDDVGVGVGVGAAVVGAALGLVIIVELELLFEDIVVDSGAFASCGN